MSEPTKKVKKAVIGAAGFGTRFLPQTKAMPKEMLPLFDKPVIQHIVEQLVEAGIEDIVIVTGYHKRSIEDHFDHMSAELRENLLAGGKEDLLEATDKISNMANFIHIRQKGVYGTATPLLNASSVLGNDPFIYLYADEVTIAKPNVFKQMIDYYEEFGGSILQCIRLEQDIEYSRYGVVSGEKVRDDVVQMNGVIEKPGKENAPSDFASVGGFLFTPDILEYLQKGMDNLGSGKEFYLTDEVIEPMIRDGHKFYGCEIKDSIRYDAGDKLGYLKAFVDFALQDNQIGPEFETYLRDVLK